MGFSNVQSDTLVLDAEFDRCLEPFYSVAIHPRYMDELACQLAGLLDEHGLSVGEVEQVLIERNILFLTPETARQLASDLVRLHREEKQKAERRELPKVVCADFADD